MNRVMSNGLGPVWLILLVLTVDSGAQINPALVPDVPPRASLIRISSPDVNQEVILTGAAGAVPPMSTVTFVNLDTAQFTIAQAAQDGSFSKPFFAPAGTSILIRADPNGATVGQILSGCSQGVCGDSSLAQFPGTILQASLPPLAAAGIPFAGAGSTDFITPGSPLWPTWTLQGSISTAELTPGETLMVKGTLKIVSPAVQSAGTIRAEARLSIERLSGPDGTGAALQNSFSSVLMTPTGLPIERRPAFEGGLEQRRTLTLTRNQPDRVESDVEMALRIPTDLPTGFYRPFIGLAFSGAPGEAFGERLFVRVAGHRRPINSRNAFVGMYLPIIRVGNPAPPRLFWTLLTDTLSNGTRGVRAVEDQDRFGVASRVLTQSEKFIIPRVNPATGRPVTYRLEPFVVTESVGDRGMAPNPPRIPFRFPSGRLTVRVQKPDGAASTIGPAPFVQARVRGLLDRNGFLLLDGGGQLTDAYQLTTMDPRFELQFTQEGRHIVTVEGNIEDVWGNTWTGGGTYEIYVARALSLDTAVIPGTQFEVGDVLAPGLVVTPPVPATVELRLRVAPNSDAGFVIEQVLSGQANRFGYFHAATGGIPLDQPGEYRIDVTASFADAQGDLWMGSRTWGGVIAPPNPVIVAHGRRGVDEQQTIGPQWFSRTQIGVPVGSSHVHFAFNSGDVMWLQKSDSVVPHITFQDPTGSISNLLRSRIFAGPFEQRAAVGETPLFSSRPDGFDPHLDPSRVDLWGYAYSSVNRPLVRVREEIAEDAGAALSLYWRFNEAYADQIGAGRVGDLPNDFKFQYGGAVLRGSALPNPQYATYGSFFVLVPDNDPGGGTRVFSPFQGNGGGPSGGPIMMLKGRDIDLFVHLTAVRPGTVLETGDTFALAGAVAPPLPALVSTTITSPSSRILQTSGRANRIGYYYRPQDDFVVDEPGIYTVDVRVTFDGQTSAGQVTQPFPTGDVLGSANGRFFVYVVSRNSEPLTVNLPERQILAPPGQFNVAAQAPLGMNMRGGHVTAMMPGFLLQTGELSASEGNLSFRYDPASLARDFPNLDLNPPADVVTVTLFASGGDAQGRPAYAAKVLALHGQELFSLNLPLPRLRRRP